MHDVSSLHLKKIAILVQVDIVLHCKSKSIAINNKQAPGDETTCIYMYMESTVQVHAAA